MKSNKLLVENPNAIYSEDYDVVIRWQNVRTVCFSYYGEKMYVGTEKMSHLNLYAKTPYIDEIAEENFGRGKYAGRLFISNRIISFWDFPPDKNTLKQVLFDIEQSIPIKFDKDWKIEVPTDKIMRLKNDTGWGSWYPTKEDQEFIRVEDYKPGFVRNKDELKIPHIESPLYKLNTTSSLKGSYKTAWDAKDNIKNRQRIFTSESIKNKKQ